MTTEEICQKYLTKYPHHTKGELADLILEKEKTVTMGRQTLRTKLYRVEKKLLEDNLIKIEKEVKWEVKDSMYHWKGSKGEISMSVEFIDLLFYEYSEHGKNFTQTQIINRHNLKVWEWNSIKSVLQLYKKSNIFSPYTVEITPPEEMTEMIKSKIAKMISNVGEQVETIHQKEIHKAYKKAVLEIEEWDLRKKIILTELADIVPQITNKVQPALRVAKDANGVLSVFIADVHFGAESRTKSIGPYSPEITEAQFVEIANEVNRLKAKEVHIFFVGDNIESATGLNHIDSWKGLAKGYYGSQLMIRAYQVFVTFLNQINNLKRVYAVPGNHDRMTDRKEVDGQGFMAEMLFEMIRLAFNGRLEVVYNEKVVSVLVDGIQVLMQHGHLKMTNINPAETILEYGNQAVFNLLVSGHLHNRIVRKDNRRFRHLICPSIFPGNDYSENLGVSSVPGFLMMKNRNGKPYMYDCPL